MTTATNPDALAYAARIVQDVIDAIEEAQGLAEEARQKIDGAVELLDEVEEDETDDTLTSMIESIEDAIGQLEDAGIAARNAAFSVEDATATLQGLDNG